MPLIAENKGKNFEIAKEGTTQAVLAGVKDLGMVDTSFNGVTKKVHKVNFIWELAELDTEGLPKLIFEKFTLSLHPKSQLYKRIKGLFNKEVPATLDLEKLIGTQTQLVLVHNEGKDKNGQSRVYANIAATLKPQPGQGKLEIVPLDKVISKKDDVKQAVAATTAVTAENPIDDMDVPF